MSRGRGRGRPDGIMMGLRKPKAKAWNKNQVKCYDESGDLRKEMMESFEVLGSYDWEEERGVPVMTVPGSAPVYQEWSGGQLEEDGASVIKNLDENRERLPQFPLEPSLHAVHLCAEIKGVEQDLNDFDIVTSRKNLRNLFILLDKDCSGRDYGRLYRFRIDIGRVGKTVFLMRHEDTEDMPARRFKTYGLDFEKKCSKRADGFRGMHRQVGSYKLGPLKVLVNYEVDCVKFDDEPEAKKEEGSVEDQLAQLLEKNLDFGAAAASPKPLSCASALQYVLKGELLEKPHKLVELGTRLKTREFRGEVFPKMFFSNTQAMAIGWHENGLCDKPQMLSLDEVIGKFGAFPEEGLGKLVTFLSDLVGWIREQPEEQKFSLIWFPKKYREAPPEDEAEVRVYVREDRLLPAGCASAYPVGTVPKDLRNKLFKALDKKDVETKEKATALLEKTLLDAGIEIVSEV